MTLTIKQNIVSLPILEKTYQIRCPEDTNEQMVRDSARYVDQEMKKIKRSGVLGLDRIAIMAALNIAHELLNLCRKEHESMENLEKRLRAIQIKIEEALIYQEEISFFQSDD